MADAKAHDGSRAEDLNAGNLTVSVIVYACNNRSTVRRCLDALTSQDFRGEREIIVVDNMPASLTRETLAGYPGIHVMPGCFEGRAHARNAAIANAKGDLLLFIDADCEPDKDWITRLTAPFKTGAGIGSVAGGVSYVRATNIPGRYYQLKIPFSMNDLIMTDLLKVSPVMSNVAYRKVVFQDLGMFDVEFGNACEDFGLWKKIDHSKRYQTVSLFGATVYYINPSIRSIWENYSDFYIGFQYWCAFYEIRRWGSRFQVPFAAFIFTLPLVVIGTPFLFLYILYKRYPVYMVIFPLFEYIRESASRFGAGKDVSFRRLTPRVSFKRLRQVFLKA